MIFAWCFCLLSFCSADAAILTPQDVSEFVVVPEQMAELHWTVSENVPPESLTFYLDDVNGKTTECHGTARLDGKTVTAGVTLPQGYWEIVFDKPGVRFGIIAIPIAQEPPDKFFAIDGALSWLVHDDLQREGMIKLVKRLGIGMVRERLRIATVAPGEGVFHFESDDRYETIRNTYKKHGVEVLELSHEVPDWMGKKKVYPKDLLKYADVLKAIAQHWENDWGAIEVWNEPDISFGGDLPADQCATVTKAFAWQLHEMGCKTPIVGGTMALPNQEWLETAKNNNLLDVIDLFSFHTYEKAVKMEEITKFYRMNLADGKHDNMPLWLTECGQPWKKGPDKPPVDQDLASATDIVMKGIEARCCGIDRYFAFVLPFFEESVHNFGMLDKSGTPIRAMAGYAQLIRTISHREYVGDLKTECISVSDVSAPPILRARVFRTQNGATTNDVTTNDATTNAVTTIVLYTGDMKPTPFTTTFPVKRAETLTGETCSGTTITDGLIYIDADVPENMIRHDTNAMKLLAYTKNKFNRSAWQHKFHSPVVAAFDYDENIIHAESKGYHLEKTREQIDQWATSKESPVFFLRVTNLSDQKQLVKIDETAAQTLSLQEKQPFEMMPRSSKCVPLSLYPEENDVIYRYEIGTFDVPSQKIVASHSLEIKIPGTPTIAGLLKQHGHAVAIPFDKELWRPNISANGRLEIEKTTDGIRLNAIFGEGDKWCYPKLPLPENVQLDKNSEIFARIRSTGETSIRIFLFGEKNDAGHLSDERAIHCPADNEWHVIRLPLSMFSPYGTTVLQATPALGQMTDVSFGFNTKLDTATLEISDWYVRP